MGIGEKSTVLAVAFTLLPIAIVAWAKKSRGLFVFGGIGAVFGLFFAPVVTAEWEPTVTVWDLIIAETGWKMEGTLIGAALGPLAAWCLWRAIALPPTDDRGRK
jgi:hypothetical protein